MFARKSWLAVATVIAGLLLPAQAMAYEAYTRVDLNLRVGPDTGYGVIDVIPYGDPVHVLGCLNGVEWCDVEWYGLRGWVAAYYLVQPGTLVYLPQVYAHVGVPIIVFSFDSYHDRYYRDRPWYKKRAGVWRGDKWRRGDKPKNYKAVVKPAKQQQVEQAKKQKQVKQKAEAPKQVEQSSKQQAKQAQKEAKRAKKKRGQEEESAE